MRAKEFIIEDEGFDASAKAAMPNASVWPDLDNSSPYHAFRFGVALAGSPNKTYPKDGPYGQKMVTLGYTKADQEILDATGRSMGFKSKSLTPSGSSEMPDNHTKSPVPFNSGKHIRRKS